MASLSESHELAIHETGKFYTDGWLSYIYNHTTGLNTSVSPQDIQLLYSP